MVDARVLRTAALALTVLGPTTQAQVGAAGEVVEVSNPVRIRLDAGAEAPLGATLHTFRTVATPTGAVGVFTGTYEVVRHAGGDLFAELVGDGAFASGGPRVGDRVEVERGGWPSAVRIESDPVGAGVSRGGYLLGVTPLRLDLSPGAHTFVLSAVGFEPAPLAMQVPVGEILSVMQSLSRPPPATQLFFAAEIAFQNADYDEAEALFAHATENADASLTAEQTATLPSFAFAASHGSGIAARGRARGMTDAAIKTAVSRVRFVYSRRTEPAVAGSAMRDLEQTLAGDPVLATLQLLFAQPIGP